MLGADRCDSGGPVVVLRWCDKEAIGALRRDKKCTPEMHQLSRTHASFIPLHAPPTIAAGDAASKLESGPGQRTIDPALIKASMSKGSLEWLKVGLTKALGWESFVVEGAVQAICDAQTKAEIQDLVEVRRRWASLATRLAGCLSGAASSPACTLGTPPQADAVDVPPSAPAELHGQ
jgi:hypothetical protein